jgi:hypothetical protein
MRLGMKWSKLKKSVEEFFCDSLKNRIEIHLTNYRAIHEPETRFWIVCDGEEIYNISKLKWIQEYYGLAEEIREVNKCSSYEDPNQKEGYYKAYDQAGDIVNKKGIISDDYFGDSLKEYLSLPFEEALISQNPIFKALAMIDKRLGIRRLKDLELSGSEHPLVKKLYEIRCNAEGIVKS